MSNNRVMKTLIIFLSFVTGWLTPVASQSCPQGWKQSSTYCYFFNNNDTVTWLEAKNECAMRMGSLLRIESADEWTFVKNNMVINPSGNGFWTSLNDRDPSAGTDGFTGTGVWLWGNDEYPLDNVVKAHWNKEPDNNDDEDCVAINMGATLSDEHCSQKMGYICEVDNTGGVCPFGWLMGPNDCFYVSNVTDLTQLLSWDDANTKCQSMDTAGQGTAYLVTLDTPADSNYFAINMPTSWNIQTTQKWWTDLSDKQTEGTYKWMNGATYYPQYVNWTQEPNNLAGREHCGTILQQGTFSDRDCTQPNNYICRKALPNQQITSKFGCGDWERAGRKCYQVYSKPPKSWNDANSYCQSVGARLMKIENMDEMNWLSWESKTAIMSWGGYWIGLSNTTNANAWQWTDGTTANNSLLLWNHEPDDFAGSEDCAAIGTDGVFTDWKCTDMRNGFICEKVQKSENCQPGWLPYSQKCYYIGSKWLTWREAYDKCNALAPDGTGSLLAINTQGELTFILNHLATLTQAPFWFWTGLTDVLTEGVWQYTTPADNNVASLELVVWNAEPNNWRGNEACVETAFGGRLNDANCAGKAGFICEKYATGVTTSSPVVAVPVSAGNPTLTFSCVTLTLLTLVTTCAVRKN